MRRRRKLWVGGGLLLAVIAIAGVVLFAAPAIPPYDFLEGHAPIRVEYAPAEIREMRELSYTRRIYSFRADYDKLVPIVDAELARHGMKLGRRRGLVLVDRNNERLYLPSPSRNHSSAEVSMHRNLRVAAANPLSSASADGWVTFVVTRDQPPGLLERFYAWLGL